MPWPVPQDISGYYRFVSTVRLRANLSDEINRAAFGNQPIIVTRRRRKIAAIVSFDDVILLENAKKRQELELARRARGPG